MKHAAFRMHLLALLLALYGAAPASAAAAGPELLTQTDVFIDIGHGGVDSGTSSQTIFEKEINLQVGLALQKRLVQLGFNTAVNRTTDMAPSEDNRWLRTRSRHRKDLAQRRLAASELKPSIVLSLHVNWAADSRPHGPVVLYRLSPQSHTLAHLLQQSLNEFYGTRKVPHIRRDLFLLNRLNEPAALIELGFISSPADRAVLTDPDKQTALAAAIARAVEEYWLLFHLD